MIDTKIPIACSLSDTELQTRRKEYLEKISAALTGSEELADGFSYRFTLTDGFLTDLAQVIDLERKCCPFLNFRTILAAGEASVTLELTGSNGTKEMVGGLFNWN